MKFWVIPTKEVLLNSLIKNQVADVHIVTLLYYSRVALLYVQKQSKARNVFYNFVFNAVTFLSFSFTGFTFFHYYFRQFQISVCNSLEREVLLQSCTSIDVHKKMVTDT